jgi:Na+/melibiose symporter-like transporter
MSLTRTQLLAYGVTGLPLAALGLPLYVYLPAFYTEGLAVAVAVVGGALLVARLLDVVTDPLAGWVSDRWPTGRARRKGLVLLGLPLLLLGVEQLFRPTAPVDGLYLASWAIVAYLGWTLVAIPYTAWGAELTDDYHGRTTVSAAREAFVVLGTLGAIVLPTVAGVAGDPAATLDVMATTLWVALPAAVLVTVLWVPVRPTAPPRQTWGVGLRVLLDNAPMRRLLLAYVLNGIANGLPATLFILFVAHVLDARDLTGPLLALYFAAGVAGLPLWLWLARRLDKHRAWAVSLWLASASFLAVPLLGAGDAAAFAVICAVSGLCLGADLAVPASIQADMVEADRRLGGEERAGLLFGIWGMATKLSLALAVGIALPVLDFTGFDANAAANGDGALLTLALLYGGLPVIIKVGAGLLMWGFQGTLTPIYGGKAHENGTDRGGAAAGGRLAGRMHEHEA